MNIKNELIKDAVTAVVMILVVFTGCFLFINNFIVYKPNTYFLPENIKEKHNLKFSTNTELVKEVISFEEERQEFHKKESKFLNDNADLKHKLKNSENASDAYQERYVEMVNFYSERVKVLEKQLLNCK